jgi:hypothetical protein
MKDKAAVGGDLYIDDSAQNVEATTRKNRPAYNLGLLH